MLLDATPPATMTELDAGAHCPEVPTQSAFVALKGREEPAINELVKVYRNLNNGLYSVQATAGPNKGRVLGYAASIGISDVELKVGEKARQTVLKKGVRHVHAYCCGRYLGSAEKPPKMVIDAAIKVAYQPFVSPRFFLRDQPGSKVATMAKAWAFGADLWCERLSEIGYD